MSCPQKKWKYTASLSPFLPGRVDSENDHVGQVDCLGKARQHSNVSIPIHKCNLYDKPAEDRV